MKQVTIWTHEGYTLRLARLEDAESYFVRNYDPLDAEVARLTGSKSSFTRDEVVSFFRRCVDDDDRYHFLLIGPDGCIAGESVINEIDWDLRSANFRIAIFHDRDRGQGIGSWMVRVTRDFAFETLRLHRLALDVYSFNPRAVRAYENTGFHREGLLKDAVKDGEAYADVILMAMLEEDWQAQKWLEHDL